MTHMTKPADWTDQEWADYSACEDDYQDMQGQMKAREDAYERGDITDEQYRNWEYDYGPVTGRDDADTSGSAETEAAAEAAPPAELVDIPEDVMTAYHPYIAYETDGG